MTQLAHGLSIIITTFNSDASISDRLIELLESLPQCGQPFEIIVVDDGSRDNSWKIIESFANHKGFIRGIRLSQHYGQHNAMLAGLRAARHQICVTLDAAGQDDIAKLPNLLRTMDEGYEVTYGYSTFQKQIILLETSVAVITLLLSVTKLFPNAFKTSSYRVFRTSLRDQFINVNNPYINLDVLLRRSAKRFQYLPVTRKPRFAGISPSNWSEQFMDITNLITSHSLRPVRLIGIASITAIISGLVIIANSKTNPGWFSGILTSLTGVVLLALTVIGEYVARNYLLSVQKYNVEISSEIEPPK